VNLSLFVCSLSRITVVRRAGALFSVDANSSVAEIDSLRFSLRFSKTIAFIFGGAPSLIITG